MPPLVFLDADADETLREKPVRFIGIYRHLSASYRLLSPFMSPFIGFSERRLPASLSISPQRRVPAGPVPLSLLGRIFTMFKSRVTLDATYACSIYVLNPSAARADGADLESLASSLGISPKNPLPPCGGGLGRGDEPTRQLRSNLAEAETKLWQQLRRKQIAGYRFRRQVPLGLFIADFVCLSARLIIEVDGGQHSERVEADAARTAAANGGRSNDFDRRLREIKLQLPEQEEIVHVIRTDDPAGIEKYWHKRFDAKRKRGEWFEPDNAVVRAIRRRKFM